MKRSIQLVAAFGLLVATNAAFAQYVDGTENNTDSGTVVSNIATVTYEVNDVVQETEENTPTTFVVDRAIMLTVDNVAGTSVAPAAQDEALEFTVTNNSNATIDIVLLLTSATGDTFNADNIGMFLESGTTVGYQEGEDNTPVPGNRLAAVTEEQSVIIWVVGDIPNSATVSDGDTASYVLLGTAYELAGDGGGKIIETPVVDADDPNDVDTVFGDAAGTYDDGLGNADSTDDQYDGRHSDTGTFTVASATITVSKTSRVVSDPFNGVGNGTTIFPKAIPGAVVEYCILVENDGGTDATNVAVSDPIPNNTTYVASSIIVADDCTGLTGATPEDDNILGADENNTGGSFDATHDAGYGGAPKGRVLTEVGTLDAGPDTTTATIFRVTVD